MRFFTADPRPQSRARSVNLHAIGPDLGRIGRVGPRGSCSRPNPGARSPECTCTPPRGRLKGHCGVKCNQNPFVVHFVPDMRSNAIDLAAYRRARPDTVCTADAEPSGHAPHQNAKDTHGWYKVSGVPSRLISDLSDFEAPVRA